MATTKDKPAPAAKDEPAAPAAPDAGLVRMVKGEESIDVHPTAVKSHQAAGWSVA